VSETVDHDSALVNEIWRHFAEGNLIAVVPLSEQLAVRFDAETDPRLVGWLGQILLTTAERISWFGRGSPLLVLGRVLALHGVELSDRLTSASGRSALGTRPGSWQSWRRIGNGSREIQARVRQAVRIHELLIGRLGADEDPELRRIALSAHVDLGPLLLVLGRYRAAACMFREDFGTDDPAGIAAVMRAATPGSSGAYRRADVAAAAMVTALPLGEPTLANDTRERAGEILRDAESRSPFKLLRSLIRNVDRFDPPDSSRA
jgi:hypothetical protein